MRKNRKNNSRTRGKRICITALLLTGSLMLGGCGGKKEKSADSELPEIVIGVDYFEPYSYQTSDGEYKGIDVELAQEAFQRLGYQPKFENIVWEDKDELLADRTIDCLWSSYSMNGREDKYQWAGPYLYSRQMVTVRAESEIQKVQDLKGKRVAVQATTKAEDLFLHNIDSDLPQMEQVNCFSTTNELYAALRKNYVDAIAGQNEPAQQQSATTPFYGIWCHGGKSEEDADAYAQSMRSSGYDAQVFVTTDWSNLNPEKFYVVTAGIYQSESEANAALASAQSFCADAYVKYSGDFQG